MREDIRKFITRSADQTRELGRSLSSCLQPGQVVCLRGDLGSGKTCLAQGICLGWGASEPAVSPSFTLVNEYQGRTPVYHFDLYRLKSPAELENIGYLEYLEKGGLVLIEWPENAGKELPQDRLDIAISPGNGDERIFTAEPRGSFIWKGDPRC